MKLQLFFWIPVPPSQHNIKNKERGKKERRAICSANIMMRMLLNIIEEFRLKLALEMPGNTISIGGEEKKAKISNNLSDCRLGSNIANSISQGTEDATKWNECLSPSIFACMHIFLFDNNIRNSLNIPKANEMGVLFSKIACLTHYLQARKLVQLGNGVTIYNEEFYTRIKWHPKRHMQTLNESTKEWFMKIRDKIYGQYLRCSPGMLMGMLNAASTTLGLIPSNHNMNRETMRVITLRSSDDSMTTYLSNNGIDNKICIEMNRKNLSIIGIN